eukprot:TRINITY_DN675_c0_g1_i1.p1 TRINITY_DN675_c0_g1~~TRINITY_DN675_c0_g1_i1.p1  ORF type:complete len:303 (+),score=45.20 TRINITY_DN675_c0_g1_i1:2-910(+)
MKKFLFFFIAIYLISFSNASVRLFTLYANYENNNTELKQLNEITGNSTHITTFPQEYGITPDDYNPFYDYYDEILYFFSYTPNNRFYIIKYDVSRNISSPIQVNLPILSFGVAKDVIYAIALEADQIYVGKILTNGTFVKVGNPINTLPTQVFAFNPNTISFYISVIKSQTIRFLVTANAITGEVVSNSLQTGWQLTSITYGDKTNQIYGICYDESSKNYYYSIINPNGQIKTLSNPISINNYLSYIGVDAFNPTDQTFTSIFANQNGTVWSIWTFAKDGSLLYDPQFTTGPISLSQLAYVF